MRRTAALLLVTGLAFAGSSMAQDQSPYPRLPAPPVKSPPNTIAPGIPGVMAGGTEVRLIRDLFRSTEGPIAMPDGSLLFTEQDAGDGQLVRMDKDDNISTFLEMTNRTIGLAYDPKGRLIGAQSNQPRVAVLHPVRTILAESFEGVPPANPNGITLSPDEKVLYAANSATISAFDVQPDGTLRNFRTFATLVRPRNAQGAEVRVGGDSMCVDEAGRVYIAAGGVQVFSPQAPAFAGPDKKTLYVVGAGAVYKVAMLARGVQGRAK